MSPARVSGHRSPLLLLIQGGVVFPVGSLLFCSAAASDAPVPTSHSAPGCPRRSGRLITRNSREAMAEKRAGDLMDWVGLRTPGVCQVPLGSQQVKDFSISFPLPGSCPCKLSSDGTREGARGEALRSLLCAGCRARRLPASSVPGGLLFRNNTHEDLFPHCWASS